MAQVRVENAVISLGSTAALEWRDPQAAVILHHLTGIAHNYKDQEHLADPSLWGVLDVHVVMRVVRVVSEVNALAEEAGSGETHVKALAAEINVFRLGVL